MMGRRKRVDALGLVLLVVGGLLVPLLGWVPGLIIVWTSPRWTTAQKVTGSLVFPVGMLSSPLWFHAWARTCVNEGCATGGGPSLAAGTAVLTAIGFALVAVVTWLTRQLIHS
jgi:hypothetical protein